MGSKLCSAPSPVCRGPEQEDRDPLTGHSESPGSVGACRSKLVCVQLSIESCVSSVFVSVQLVQAFTHAPAALEADRGGKFHMVDGNVTGEFTDLVSKALPRCRLPWLA